MASLRRSRSRIPAGRPVAPMSFLPRFVALGLGLLFALGGAPAAGADPPFEVRTLDNGLTLLLAPSDAHPVIAVSGFVTTGGRTEDEYYQGSLHYIEHLVYKGGTPNLAPTEFRKKMSLLGREAGGWTWDDEINFGFEVPTANFRDALETYREAVLDLEFSPEWFEDEKRVVLQEMTRGFEQPDRVVENAWNALAFVEHPYGRPVIGSEKAILDLQMDRTYEYYQERFSPNHWLISVAGDFQVDRMVEAFEEVWGGEKRGPAAFELGFEEPTQLGPRRRVDHLATASMTTLLVGCVTPGGRHDDDPALTLLAELFDDDSYGLPQYLLDQEKWVQSVDADHYSMRDYGCFRISARCAPEKAAAVEEFVTAFLVDFDPTSVPASVFEQSRRRLFFAEAQRRDTAARRAERNGFLASRHGIEGALAREEMIAALTPQAVADAKNRWISGRRIVTAVVHPESFDPAAAPVQHVEPGAPLAPDPPDLDRPGALVPAGPDALAWEKTDEADGVLLFTYANGMRLLVDPTAASPLLAVTGRVLGGQWVEPKGKAGINLFLSELGLRGTRRWDREGFSRLLGALSVSATAHVSVGSRANTSLNVDYRDSAAHHLVGLAVEWPSMLAILKETLFFPAFDAGEIDKLRSDQIDAVRSLPENNLEYIKQEFYRAAYAGHPYGSPTRGDESSLAAITPEDLRAFHAMAFTPDRTVIAVVGDADPEEVAAWIATRWADLPANGKTEPWSIDPAEHPLTWDPPGETRVLDLGKDYWTVNWGRPGAAAGGDDWWASVVLGRVAGSDHFYRYVYEEGVSYRSWIRFWAHLGPGAWILENDVKRDRFDEVLGMFDEDLVRYSTTGFSEKEFDEAVLNLTNGRILDAQDNTRLAWRLARAEGDGLGFRHETGYVGSLRGVSYEEVQALARRIFTPEEILRVVQQ